MGDGLVEAQGAGVGTLVALVIVIGVSLWLGLLAERAIREKAFLRSYFLGNRGLGVWVLALTTTVQSGGTFMGFPSLVYSHGWIVAVWICSYMVVPLTGFGILGKRLAQISRRTGAITVPDLFRERFASPALGLVSSLLILFFMVFLMTAQFKAGAIVMKLAWPGSGALALSEDPAGSLDRAYYIGLAVFTVTVVGYTIWGGFLASAWTDLFQSVLMLIGVMILFCLVVPAAGGMEAATRQAVANTSPAYAFGPGYSADGRQFLTGPLAVSFFFVWTLGGLGSPPGMVRIMACRDTAAIRRSIFVLGAYNVFIYLPLIVICICGRALIGNLAQTDEIIPRLAISSTRSLPGGSLVAGLILAAPFGAILATVSTYLVVLASGIVRDIYQRFIDPDAGPRALRRLTFAAMVLLGLLGWGASLNPPNFLQTLIVFSSSGQASSFVVPALMMAYWRRATAAGAIAAMLAGAATVLALFLTGYFVGTDPGIGQKTLFRPYFLLGLEPVIWGVCVSAIAGIGVSLLTRRPAPPTVERLFDAATGPHAG